MLREGCDILKPLFKKTNPTYKCYMYISYYQLLKSLTDKYSF